MSQQDVYSFLKKHKGKWFTSKDVAHMSKVSRGSITNSLKKLRESSSVNFKYASNKNEGTKKSYFYRFK